jgi:hypothetical protein
MYISGYAVNFVVGIYFYGGNIIHISGGGKICGANIRFGRFTIVIFSRRLRNIYIHRI